MASPQAINELAKRCGLAIHPDPSVTLGALKKLIGREIMAASAMDTMTSSDTSQPKCFTLDSFPTGCAPTGNRKVDDAIRILRLIHIQRHRELQTKINEILSKMQMITGDPKADLTIGRVGR